MAIILSTTGLEPEITGKTNFLVPNSYNRPPTRWLGDFMFNLEKVTYGHLSRREIDETIGVQKL